MNQVMRIYERDLRNQQRKIRRRREVRRIFILAGIAIVLALATALFCHGLLSNAKTYLINIIPASRSPQAIPFGRWQINMRMKRTIPVRISILPKL